MSLHPVKAKKRSRFSLKQKKPMVRYGRLHVQGGWEIGHSNYLHFPSWSKIALLTAIMLSLTLIPAYAYWGINILPQSQPSGPCSYALNTCPNDPFTILWNGTITSSPPGYVSTGFNDNCSSNLVCTATLSVTQGNGIVIAVFYQGFGFGNPAISDSFSSVWVSDAFIQSFGNIRMAIWHTLSVASSGSDTFNICTGCFTNGAPFDFTVNQFRGLTSVGALANNDGAGAPANSGTNTQTITTLAGSIVFETFHFRDSVCESVTLNSGQVLIRQVSLQPFVPCTVATTAYTANVGAGSNSFTIGWSGGSSPQGMNHLVLELRGSFGNNCPPGYSCVNSNFDLTGHITQNPNATFAALALTKSPIDLSTGASKELLFFETWLNASPMTGPWGWYLTKNATLPATAGYNPLNDPTVSMMNVVYWGSTQRSYVYLQKNINQPLGPSSGLATDPYPTCPQSSTLYICASNNVASSLYTSLSTVLNYTGCNQGTTACGTNEGLSLLCSSMTGETTLNFCASATTPPNYTPCTSALCATQTLPFLNIQASPLYLGFWSSAGNGANLKWGTSNTGTFSNRANGVYYWVPNPTANTPSVTQPTSFFGWLGNVIGGAFGIAGNILGTTFGPLLNVGGSIMNAFISATIESVGFLANAYIAEMNVFGNLVGLGPLGTDLANLFSGAFTLLSNGLTWLITGLGWIVALAARTTDVVTILTNAAGPIFTLALTALLRATSSISIILTLLYWTFLTISLLFLTLEILLFFLLLGDYGAAGFHAWFETTNWFIFGTGIKYLIVIFNFGLDIISAGISLLPKPLIHMSGISHWPRLPIFEVGGSPTLPNGSMEAARQGNLFTFFGWVLGIVFTFAYESTSLPGSIAAFVPAAASETAPIATALNVLYIVLFLMGTMLIFLLPAQLMNAFPMLDLGKVPGREIKLSARSPQVQIGSVKVSRRPAQKRFAGFVEKRLEAKKVIKPRVPEGLRI